MDRTLFISISYQKVKVIALIKLADYEQRLADLYPNHLGQQKATPAEPTTLAAVGG